jgi:predicted dehydrogenase
MLTAAVVGLGNIGGEHVRALARTPGARLVGVCDRSSATARALAERWGVNGAYTDVQEMLDTAGPQVVHIATPPASHASLALQCLAAGAHVLVEKPLGTSPEEVDRILDEAGRRGLYVVENYNYLWNRQLLQLRTWARDGRLGEVCTWMRRWRSTCWATGARLSPGTATPSRSGLRGGLVADFLPHLASIAFALLGPHEAASTVWAKRSESLLPADEMRALVRHGAGTSSLGFSSHARPAGFRLTVVGSRMRVRADIYGTLLAVESERSAPGPLVPVLNGFSVSRSEVSGALGGLRRKLDGGPATLEGLWGLVEQLYADLGRGDQPAISHEDVRAVNRLTAELAASAP